MQLTFAYTLAHPTIRLALQRRAIDTPIARERHALRTRRGHRPPHDAHPVRQAPRRDSDVEAGCDSDVKAGRVSDVDAGYDSDVDAQCASPGGRSSEAPLTAHKSPRKRGDGLRRPRAR
ncbi:hypothetical protein B0H10DRAFT_2442764 [Mycena sp. CBHHK59/15]|nr:hypothetical protein B0H10DRAFT_2442764 [Mycena sp. CBHHK59/15]